MKILSIMLFLMVSLYANSTNNAFKNCQVVVLSELTDLVSCQKIDYLVEYAQNDEYKRGEVKKVSAVTNQDVKVIKQ